MERYFSASVPFKITKSTIYSTNEVPLAGTAPRGTNLCSGKRAILSNNYGTHVGVSHGAAPAGHGYRVLVVVLHRQWG